MDLNPETGQYRLSASVPYVEGNDLRRTLAIRPLPFPVGGGVRGVLHVTGPLETPVFSGEVRNIFYFSWHRVQKGPFIEASLLAPRFCRECEFAQCWAYVLKGQCVQRVTLSSATICAEVWLYQSHHHKPLHSRIMS